jgi:hypothetical protein
VGARAHHFLLKKSDSLAMFAAIRRASSRVSSFAAVAISLGISFKQLHTYKEALALGHCNKNGRLVSRSKKKFGAPWAGIRGLAAAGLVHTDITKEGSPTNSQDRCLKGGATQFEAFQLALGSSRWTISFDTSALSGCLHSLDQARNHLPALASH